MDYVQIDRIMTESLFPAHNMDALLVVQTMSNSLPSGSAMQMAK